MSIFISPNIVLSQSESDTLLWPVFLGDSRITTIAAGQENPLYPASNLLNPQTSSLWKSGSTTDFDIIVDLDIDGPIDAFGWARHNFGSGQVGLTAYGKTSEPGADWELAAEISPGNDKPIIGIIEQGYFTQMKFSLAPGSVQPQAAVLYVGKLLRMPTGIPTGHIPLFDALDTEMLTGRAENGDFLGDIITSQRLGTTVDFRNLDGDWYRENMRPFVISRTPFFFGWSPLMHPNEAGFAKFNGSPKPTITQGTGEIDISLPLTGLAL